MSDDTLRVLEKAVSINQISFILSILDECGFGIWGQRGYGNFYDRYIFPPCSIMNLLNSCHVLLKILSVKFKNYIT